MDCKAGSKSGSLVTDYPAAFLAVLYFPGGRCDLASSVGREIILRGDELEGMKLVQSHRPLWPGLGHLAPD